ncbi:lamin-A-like [Thunnus albacares]|uniref:lamin-A-like n=1 Tax=Thunnus albacares TaxID=8236 RepID=UPI001CF6ADCF|nr:lamin-A-like [Thunnus albacares]
MATRGSYGHLKGHICCFFAFAETTDAVIPFWENNFFNTCIITCVIVDLMRAGMKLLILICVSIICNIHVIQLLIYILYIFSGPQNTETRKPLILVSSSYNTLMMSSPSQLEASQQKVAELQKQNSCTTIQRSVRGDIFVEEVDLNGKYVRLSNKSNKEQQLKGELQMQVNNRKDVIFRFDSYKLKAGKTITIWAQDSIPWHKIATDLKGQNQISWGPEDRVLVTLFSSSREEMAMRSHNPQHRQQT